MEKIIIREDVVKGFGFYLQQKLERFVEYNILKFSHYRQLHSEIDELCGYGVINYNERNEIHAQLKTMFCDVFRKMGLKAK